MPEWLKINYRYFYLLIFPLTKSRPLCRLLDITQSWTSFCICTSCSVHLFSKPSFFFITIRKKYQDHFSHLKVKWEERKKSCANIAELNEWEFPEFQLLEKNLLSWSQPAAQRCTQYISPIVPVYPGSGNRRKSRLLCLNHRWHFYNSWRQNVGTLCSKGTNVYQHPL